MRAFADLLCRAGGLSKGAGGARVHNTFRPRETSGYETEGIGGRYRVDQSLTADTTLPPSPVYTGNTRQRKSGEKMKTRALLEREASRHPECVIHFTAGLQSVFGQWTALELAIHHQWGGAGQGVQQVSALIEEIRGLFLGPEIIYKDDVSLVLEDFMETNFNTLLDDGSSDEIGELLCTMWRKCSVGDFSVVAEIRGKEAQRTQQMLVLSSRGLDATGDILVEGDEEDDDDSVCIPNSVFRQAVAQELDKVRSRGVQNGGEEGEKEEEEQECEAMNIPDADGFLLVQTGKSRKGKKGKV